MTDITTCGFKVLLVSVNKLTLKSIIRVKNTRAKKQLYPTFNFR